MSGRRRTVLFVDHETRLSGGQLVLRDLLVGLAERGLELHLAVPGDGALPSAAAAAGVRIHHYRVPESLRTLSRWQLSRRPHTAARLTGEIVRACRDLHGIARAVAPTVVHTNSLKAHLLAVPVTRLNGTPQVWHVHDIVEGPPRTLLALAAAISGTRLVCISDAVAAALPGRFGSRIRVVHNGVPQHRADAGPARAFRARAGAGPDQLLVTMVGQVASWKGQDVVVEAARALQDRSDICFAVVGDCLYPENEADFHARTRAASADLESVTWTGRIEPVEPVMAGSDIVVHASRLAEPFGRVLVEAMAQGTPVISNTLGAAPELVPPDAGMLIPPDDAAALAEAIETLADDESRRAAMAARAPAAAAAFTVERMVEAVLAVYEELATDA